jgi:hypothetical protein
MSHFSTRAFAPLAIVLGLLTLGSGCCSPCGAGRPLTSYNYNPVYPTAYNPGYTSAVSYGTVAPVQTGCSSCGGVPAF